MIELRAAFLAEITGSDPNEPALLDALERYFTSTIPSGKFIAMLSVAEDRVIATSGLVIHRHPPSARNLEGISAHVMNMYTLPGWRGRGIASTLLLELLKAAREYGCARVSLHTLPASAPIYLRAGFVSADDEMTLELL